jgi:hypothetical protein
MGLEIRIQRTKPKIPTELKMPIKANKMSNI